MANNTEQSAPEPRGLDVELLIAQVLRVGVFGSAALLAGGLLIYLVQQAGQAGDWHTTIDAVGKNSQLYKLGNLIPALFRLEPLALVEAGVVLLILTPIIRVAASVLIFARERDMLYVAITVIVLFVLLLGWFGI